MKTEMSEGWLGWSTAIEVIRQYCRVPIDVAEAMLVEAIASKRIRVRPNVSFVRSGRPVYNVREIVSIDRIKLIAEVERYPEPGWDPRTARVERYERRIRVKLLEVREEALLFWLHQQFPWSIDPPNRTEEEITPRSGPGHPPNGQSHHR
jgi:hypothetical protein